MPSWYEVFDNSEVQYVTRRRVALVSGTTTALLALAFAAALYAYAHGAPDAVVATVLGSLWTVVVAGGVVRLRRLRRVVWCVKLSDREVVGYDYARRKLRIDWIDAERVELTEHGLAVVGPPPCTLEIPHLFPDFATLSHRIVHYAELYEVPVFVGDRPWQQLDVYDLYPFLDAHASEEPPHPRGTG